MRRPLQWLPLCAPPNVSSRASAVVPPHTTKGLPLGLVSRLPMRAGRLMVAPTRTLTLTLTLILALTRTLTLTLTLALALTLTRTSPGNPRRMTHRASPLPSD